MPTTSNRRKQFKAALALTGMTALGWAEKQDVTPSHLYAVLRGTRESQSLTAKIDAFIAEHAPAISAAVA